MVVIVLLPSCGHTIGGELDSIAGSAFHEALTEIVQDFGLVEDARTFVSELFKPEPSRESQNPFIEEEFVIFPGFESSGGQYR